MGLMEFYDGRKDEDVIEVNDDKVVQDFSEDIVLIGVEMCLGHYTNRTALPGTQNAESSSKCCFPLAPLTDLNKVRGSQIKFGEDLSGSESLEQFRNERVSFFYGDLVKLPLVDTRSQ